MDVITRIFVRGRQSWRLRKYLETEVDKRVAERFEDAILAVLKMEKDLQTNSRSWSRQEKWIFS